MFRRTAAFLTYVVLAFLLCMPAMYAQVSLSMSHLALVHGLVRHDQYLSLARVTAQHALYGGQDRAANAILCYTDLAVGDMVSAFSTCSLAEMSSADLVNIGRQLERTRHLPKARSTYRFAQSMHPGSALPHFVLATRSENSDDRNWHLRQALKLIDAGDKSLRDWETIEVFLEIARLYMQRDRYEEVAILTRRAALLLPTSRGLRLQAEALARLGDFDGAWASLEEAKKIDESFWIRLTEGKVYELQGDLESAARSYTNGMQESSGSDRIFGCRHLCEMMIAESLREPAIEACTLLVQESSEASWAVSLLDRAYSIEANHHTSTEP